MPSHCNSLAPTLSRLIAVQRAFREEWMKARSKDRTALREARRLMMELEALYRELKGETAYRPFSYDHEKAREYGFSELTIEKHTAAQELIDAIFARDPRYVPITASGTYDINEEAVEEYWKRYCYDLPNIPQHSPWYFRALARHHLSQTIDNDDPNNLTNPTVPHIPRFGDKEFMLVMDFPEFDYDKAAQKRAALTPQTKKILKELFGTENPTSISRDKINTALWADHDARVQSDEAKKVIRTLLGTGTSANPDDYELRLLRPNEYARATKTQNFGDRKLWTHMDGYCVLGVGRRGGLCGGNRDHGGAASANIDHRDYRNGNLAVRLVLVRR